MYTQPDTQRIKYSIQCQQRRNEQQAATLAASYSRCSWMKTSGLTIYPRPREERATKQRASWSWPISQPTAGCRPTKSLKIRLYSCQPLAVGHQNTTSRGSPKRCHDVPQTQMSVMLARVHVLAVGRSRAPWTLQQWALGCCLSSRAASHNIFFVRLRVGLRQYPVSKNHRELAVLSVTLSNQITISCRVPPHISLFCLLSSFFDKTRPELPSLDTSINITKYNRLRRWPR